ncbi:MAG: hypothetical protein ABSG91_17655 [Syntrophobacteraceae bacterium]|jgi:hypothetical protein
MAKMEFANAKMERAVPGNPGKKCKSPHVTLIPNRNRKSVRKPTLDARRDIPEINLYGP